MDKPSSYTDGANMCFSSAPSNDNSALQQQQQQAAATAASQQAAINQGEGNIQSVFSGYTPSYYTGLSDDYSDYYTPQVQQQDTQAAQKLLYSQANQGITNSSGAQYEDQLLNQENAQDLQNVQSNAQSYANGAKQQVGNLENNLTQQLNTSYDPSQITPSALNQLNIQSVSSMTPLTGLFSDLTNVYGNLAQNQAAQSNQNALAGAYYQTPSTGGTGANTSSSTTVS